MCCGYALTWSLSTRRVTTTSVLFLWSRRDTGSYRPGVSSPRRVAASGRQASCQPSHRGKQGTCSRQRRCQRGWRSACVTGDMVWLVAVCHLARALEHVSLAERRARTCLARVCPKLAVRGCRVRPVTWLKRWRQVCRGQAARTRVALGSLRLPGQPRHRYRGRTPGWELAPRGDERGGKAPTT